MPLLDDMKLALRITSEVYDDEISTLILAAQSRLRRGGVSAELVEAGSDPLLQTAITMYLKANFGLDNPDADKYMRVFDQMMVVLALADDAETVS